MEKEYKVTDKVVKRQVSRKKCLVDKEMHANGPTCQRYKMYGNIRHSKEITITREGQHQYVGKNGSNILENYCKTDHGSRKNGGSR